MINRPLKDKEIFNSISLAQAQLIDLERMLRGVRTSKGKALTQMQMNRLMKSTMAYRFLDLANTYFTTRKRRR